MEFRYHPIIENLKINENGTEIYFNDVLLPVFINDKERKNPTLKVNFFNKTHSVARLVCETWNGLRAHSAQRTSKIDFAGDNHYSNLEWKEGSTNGVANFTQKLKLSDIDEIIELYKSNKTYKEIAKIFEVHFSTIGRIIKRYDKKDK